METIIGNMVIVNIEMVAMEMGGKPTVSVVTVIMTSQVPGSGFHDNDQFSWQPFLWLS